MEGRNIKTMPISDVKPYEGSHEISPSIEPLKKSISDFGLQQPVLIDSSNTIVAGNAIYKACVELGYTEIPVIELNDLTEEQVKQYRIADNKTSEFARWNEEKLKKELSYLDNPESLQFCFNEDLSRYFGQTKSTETTQNPALSNNEDKDETSTQQGNETSALISVKHDEQDEQQFRDRLNSISKEREVKPQSYIEHVCSKCGKKIIINV